MSNVSGTYSYLHARPTCTPLRVTSQGFHWSNHQSHSSCFSCMRAFAAWEKFASSLFFSLCNVGRTRKIASLGRPHRSLWYYLLYSSLNRPIDRSGIRFKIENAIYLFLDVKNNKVSWIFQVHRLLQRTAVRLSKDQPVAIVPDPSDCPRSAALWADGLSSLS